MTLVIINVYILIKSTIIFTCSKILIRVYYTYRPIKIELVESSSQGKSLSDQHTFIKIFFSLSIRLFVSVSYTELNAVHNYLLLEVLLKI